MKRTLELLFIVNTLGIFCVSGQESCSDATNCCGCVRTPGCSWFHSPSLAAPYCDVTPYDNLNTSLGLMTPDRLYADVSIRRNAPINPYRRKMIAPQRVNVDMSLGTSADVMFRVQAPERVFRLRIQSPYDELKFEIDPAQPGTCGDRGLLRMESSMSRSDRRRPTRPMPRPRPNHMRMSRSTGRSAGRSGRRSLSRPDRNQLVGQDPTSYGGPRPSSRRSRIPRQRRLTIECNSPAAQYVTQFRLQISAVRCYTRPKFIKVMLVSSSSRSAPLKVTVVPRCECPCDSTSSTSSTSTSSSSSPADSDETCTEACDQSGVVARQEPVCSLPVIAGLCRNRQSDNTALCSGHGTCVCEQCSCQSIFGIPNARYTGEYCQCNDYDCPMENGALCGGPTRGQCVCGQCQCMPGFEGPSCACVADASLCMSPEGEVCSGHGDCVCGQCECEAGFSGDFCSQGRDAACSGQGLMGSDGVCQCEYPFEGERCEVCPRCVDVRCDNNRLCVACQIFAYLDGTADCAHCRNNTDVYPTVTYIPHDNLDEFPDNMCVYPADMCSFEFSFQSLPGGSMIVNFNRYAVSPMGTPILNPTRDDCIVLPVSACGGPGCEDN